MEKGTGTQAPPFSMIPEPRALQQDSQNQRPRTLGVPALRLRSLAWVLEGGAGPCLEPCNGLCAVLLPRPAALSGLTSAEAPTTPPACALESTPTSGSPRQWHQRCRVSAFKPEGSGCTGAIQGGGSGLCSPHHHLVPTEQCVDSVTASALCMV